MDDILQCPICYENYNFEEKIPKQLDCQHILCSKCLPYMVKNSPTSSIECPLCKEHTNKHIQDVPRSLIVLQIIEATKNNSTKFRQIRAPQIPPRPSVQQPSIPQLPPLPTLNRPELEISSNRISAPTPEKETNSYSKWDLKSFLKKIFNEMDLNRDGSITAYELQEVLKRGQGNLNFKT